MTNKPLVMTAGLPTATQLSSSDLSDGPCLPLAGGTMTGAVKASDGAAATPSVYWDATKHGFWNDTTNSGIGISVAATQIAYFNSLGLAVVNDSGAAVSNVYATSSAAQLNSNRFSNDASAPSISGYKSRGTRTSPATPNLNDSLCNWFAGGYDGTANRNGVQIQAQMTETGTVGSANFGCRYKILIVPVGSGTLAEVARFENETGFSMFGLNPVIDQNRTHIHRSYTIGTLPTAVTGGMIYCSDLGGGGQLLQSNGTNWMRTGLASYEARSLATGAETLNTLTNANYVNYTANLTANVTVTLGTTNAYKGAVFVIRNKGTGAFTFAIVNGGAGAGTLVTFAASTAKEATCVYDGTNWVLMQDSLI